MQWAGNRRKSLLFGETLQIAGEREIPEECELTGFSPRIDWIFPSSTSKRFSKGWGLGFRAEILGVG